MNNSRSLESVTQDIINFYQQNGRRPTQQDLPAVNAWLRRQDQTLATRCTKLGL